LNLFLRSSVTEGKPNLAFIKYSFEPGNVFMHHTIDSISGRYFTIPTVLLKNGVFASIGTGIIISTFEAYERDLNWDLVFTTNSIFVDENASIATSTQNNGFTYVESLYDIKSNLPSGGINVITLSLSNLSRFTHS